MGIAVVGSITRDTLMFPRECDYRVTRSLGGILYTTIAMASVSREMIIPVCNIGFDVYDDVRKILGQFDNIDLSNLRRLNIRNIHCHIFYTCEYGTQYDEGREVPISYQQVKSLMPRSKFVFVSPMTGFDIQLSTLQKIKQNARCPVYFDYHILSLGRDSLGNRFLYKKDNWLEWCLNCDFLQLNEFEAKLLNDNPIHSKKDALDFSKAILAGGVKSVAITLGSKGAFICYHEGREKPKCKYVVGLRVDKVIDATGCGDVFAAGFISHFIESGNLLESYYYANRLAGLKTKISGIEGLSELLGKKKVQGIHENDRLNV